MAPSPYLSDASQYGSPVYSPNPEYIHAYSVPPQYYYNPSSGGHPEELASNSRTVYLGHIAPETTPEEILNHVRSGVVESFKLLPEKNCAFISFLSPTSASHFYSEAILKRLTINSQDVKVGWGKSAPVSTEVALATSQDDASRNVYLGNLPGDITEQEIRSELSRYGPIDTVKLILDKNIGFVHFLSISAAIKAVQQLPFESNWSQRKIFYGRDRCAYISKIQKQNAAQYLGIAPGYEHLISNADHDLISTALAQQSAAAVAVATAAGGASNVGNRTVYLGSVHPETTIEEICNVVRGGLLHHIRYLPEKHICFVTFVDPTAAAQFFAIANLQGLSIHNRRLKIGWGKHSGPLPQAIAMAVTTGASRNVYIGNITAGTGEKKKDANWPESKLRQDFSEYGDIEQINFLPEKSCAFVNFTNLANAITAIDRIKLDKPGYYKKFKINFGKDRCGNLSRQLQQPLPQQNHQQQFVPVVGGALGLGIIDEGSGNSSNSQYEEDDGGADTDEYLELSGISGYSGYGSHLSATSTTITIPEVEEVATAAILEPEHVTSKTQETVVKTPPSRLEKKEDQYVIDDETAAEIAAAAARTFGIISASEKRNVTVV